MSAGAVTGRASDAGVSAVLDAETVSLDAYAVAGGAVLKVCVGAAKAVVRLDSAARDHLVARLAGEGDRP